MTVTQEDFVIPKRRKRNNFLPLLLIGAIIGFLSGVAVITDAVNPVVNWFTAGNITFAMNSDGNIGVNIANPTVDFEVNGTANITEIAYVNNSQICTAANGVCGAASGDITAVTAGTGLLGGGISGNVTVSADTTYLQRLVTGTCPVGSSIRVINSTGGVTCETDDDTTSLFDLDVAGDTGSGTVNDSQTFTVTGTSGVNTSYSGQTLSVFVDATICDPTDNGEFSWWNGSHFLCEYDNSNANQNLFSTITNGTVGAVVDSTTDTFTLNATGTSRIECDSGNDSCTIITSAHTIDTNCNASGSCSANDVAYLNYANTGDFNISGNISADHLYGIGGSLGVGVSDDGTDVTLHAEVGGVNSFFIDTDGAFLELIANPGMANNYLMFAIEETQGVSTNINFYEGGVGHNRLWDSGSARFGGDESHLCSNLTTDVDCDTAGTGADVVVQDDIWAGGKIFSSDWSNTTITESQVLDLVHTTDTNLSGSAAGGDLSGTYPNPSVKDDSHLHDLANITNVGNLDLDSTDDITTSGGTITGNLVVNGDFTLVGSVFNATVTNQYLNGSFLPSIHDTFDIGNTTRYWSTIYSTLYVGSMDWSNLTSVPAGFSDGTDDVDDADADPANELQDLWFNISGDTGWVNASDNNDNLSILGGGTVSTSITGKTITITGSAHTTDTDTNETTRVEGLIAENTSIYSLINNVNTTANIEDLGFVTGAHTVDTNFSGTNAGGDLTGTYPFPQIQNDSHNLDWANVTNKPSLVVPGDCTGSNSTHVNVTGNITTGGVECVAVVYFDTDTDTQLSEVTVDGYADNNNYLDFDSYSGTCTGNNGTHVNVTMNVTSSGVECAEVAFIDTVGGGVGDNNYTTAASVIGEGTKTLHLSQATGSNITATWTDLNSGGTNCNATGSCSENGVAYVNFTNNGWILANEFSGALNWTFLQNYASSDGNASRTITNIGDTLTITDITIGESQISDLAHTTDTNCNATGACGILTYLNTTNPGYLTLDFINAAINYSNLQNYPSAGNASQYVSVFGDTNTYGNILIGDGNVLDTLTVSGGVIGSNSISGTLTTTSTLTIGDGGDAVNVDSSTWDVDAGNFTSVVEIGLTNAARIFDNTTCLVFQSPDGGTVLEVCN